MALFCQKCGAENQDTSNFCFKCGNQMRPDAGQIPQQYQQPQPPAYYQQQPPPSTGSNLKDTFVHSAASGAGTYAGCCCMNALSNLLCDACE